MLKTAMATGTCILIGSLFLTGCSTTVRSYPVTAGTERQGGIPFFLPKPILQVREPIEIKRIETLHVIFDVGGMEQFSIELKPGNIDQAIANLKRTLGAGEIQIESKEKIPFYLKEELEKEKTVTGEHQSSETERSKKYEAQTGTDAKSELKPLYKPADVEKALSIIWIPNTEKEYELVITPSSFASSDLSIKLTDGWRLDTISAKTGDNQLIKELGDTLRTVIGAQKEVKVAEISREQAIKLKEMELASKSDEGQKMLSLTQEKTKIPLRIVGFARKTTITAITPGLHELLFNNGTVAIPQLETVVWEKVSL